jgi:hypothetical protein
MVATHLTGLRAAMEAHLDECSEDWDTRRVLADLLDELGEEALAAGQRWQAAQRKRPVLSNHEDESGYGWFDVVEFPQGNVDPESDLPTVIFARLPPNDFWSGRSEVWSCWYPDRATAEEALARALQG